MSVCEDQTSVIDHTPFTPEGDVSDGGVVPGASASSGPKLDADVSEDRLFSSL